MESSKKILWYNLAFMAFSTVWGFGNVLFRLFQRYSGYIQLGSDVRFILRALCIDGW